VLKAEEQQTHHPPHQFLRNALLQPGKQHHSLVAGYRTQKQIDDGYHSGSGEQRHQRD